MPLLFGIGFLLVVLAIRVRGVRSGPAYLLIGIAAWVAFFKSGVDPVVVGLVMGLLTYAYPATRASLEQASEAFRNFREQPTAELAQSARDEVRVAISPNDRLALLFHPWSSYVIVPLFALANAGIVLNASFLAQAYTSPVTLGIIIGYLVGKPVGTAGCAWLVTRLSHGRLRPPVGWGAVAGAGAVAGIGFTVSLLIASLALSGVDLAEAKLGILTAALCATGLTWIIFRAVNRLPTRRGCARCWARPRSSPTWWSRSTTSATTSGGPSRRRSPWSNTGTSSARTAAWPSRRCGNCSATSVTCGTCGGTCR